MIRRVALPTQIYIPSPKRGGRAFAPTEKRFRPFKADGHAGWGKPSGGLWTSTYATHTDSGWFGWCSLEQPNWLHRFGYLLEPVECRVWEIASRRDHDEFHDRYARPISMDGEWFEDWKKPMGREGLGILSCQIDWSAVTSDCDAVRLANPWEMRWGGENGGRWAHTITFSGWDCESTWWGHWLFSKVKKINLPEVACERCAGTGWLKPPDHSRWALHGTHEERTASLEAIYREAEECPECEGSGRRPSD